MSLSYVAFKNNEFTGYVYTGKSKKVEKRSNTLNRFVPVGTVYKFRNRDGLKSISVILPADREIKGFDIRENEEVIFDELVALPLPTDRSSRGITQVEIYCSAIYPKDSNNRPPVAKQVRTFMDSIKKQANAVDFTNYLNVRDYPIDYDATFGVLHFGGFRNQTYVRTFEGELTTEVESQRFSLYSDLTQDDFTVVVKGARDYQFTPGQEVEMLNPVIESYAIDRDTFGFRVVCDDIVEKGKGNAREVFNGKKQHEQKQPQQEEHKEG